MVPDSEEQSGFVSFTYATLDIDPRLPVSINRNKVSVVQRCFSAVQLLKRNL